MGRPVSLAEPLFASDKETIQPRIVVGQLCCDASRLRQRAHGDFYSTIGHSQSTSPQSPGYWQARSRKSAI